jgi:hypothetical protein
MPNSGPDQPDPVDELVDLFLPVAWTTALRLSLESGGALERCGRRACRKSGSCRMEVKEGRPLDCGGGVSPEAVHRACFALLFGSLMASHAIHSLTAGPGQGGVADAKGAALPGQVGRRRRAAATRR